MYRSCKSHLSTFATQVITLHYHVKTDLHIRAPSQPLRQSIFIVVSVESGRKRKYELSLQRLTSLELSILTRPYHLHKQRTHRTRNLVPLSPPPAKDTRDASLLQRTPPASDFDSQMLVRLDLPAC